MFLYALCATCAPISNFAAVRGCFFDQSASSLLTIDQRGETLELFHKLDVVAMTALVRQLVHNCPLDLLVWPRVRQIDERVLLAKVDTVAVEGGSVRGKDREGRARAPPHRREAAMQVRQPFFY